MDEGKGEGEGLGKGGPSVRVSFHPRFLFPPHANLRTSIARYLNACALLRV